MTQPFLFPSLADEKKMNEIKVLTPLYVCVCESVCECMCVCVCGLSDIMIRLQEVQFSLISKWFRLCGLWATVCVGLSRYESL